MSIEKRHVEPLTWAGLAFAGGLLAGWVDRNTFQVQGPILVLMIVNFAINLPGRASASVTTVLTVAGMIAYKYGALGVYRPAMLIVLVPAATAAFGAKLFGSLLDRTASSFIEPVVDDSEPWYRRPLSTRMLLAIALMAITAAGVPLVQTALASLIDADYFRAVRFQPLNWIAAIWQIITLLGWIAITPLLLKDRAHLFTNTSDLSAGPAAIDIAGHAAIVLSLTILHAMVVVSLMSVLVIPTAPAFSALARTAFLVYLPLDFLTYITILALGYASDLERHRRDAAQQEVTLRAESLDSRMSALRARLNPHFLFNALNSVSVLARSGRSEETGTVVDGITSLLRYVLDERRANVPLGEELEFVRDYLTVQQVRFGDRLRFTIDCADDAAAATIPQLLLQPIVENAVEHGIANALNGGAVTVEVTRDDDALVLVIADDGPGIVDSPSATGIGLSHTRERIARLFGSRGHLTATASHRPGQGGGTRVMIRIPYEENRSAA